VYYVLN